MTDYTDFGIGDRGCCLSCDEWTFAVAVWFQSDMLPHLVAIRLNQNPPWWVNAGAFQQPGMGIVK